MASVYITSFSVIWCASHLIKIQIYKTKDLKGKLLICQGAVDPVVVWEQSLSFIRECIKNNVQVDYFPYPCAEHNVMGRDRIHLMQKVTNYFEDYLK